MVTLLYVFTSLSEESEFEESVVSLPDVPHEEPEPPKTPVEQDVPPQNSVPAAEDDAVSVLDSGFITIEESSNQRSSQLHSNMKGTSSL